MIVMSIMVKSVNFDDYQKTQTSYKDTNFLQSAEMAKLQLSRNHIGEVEALVFERDGLIVGQTIIVYRRSFRIFRKALLLHGPLLDYNSITDLPDLLEALILYLKKKNIASLSIHPYLTNLIRNEELEILKEDKADEVSKVFEKLGFEQYLDPEQALVVNQMFVKPIDTFTTSDEMLAAFSPSLKRDLKKFTALNVKVEELSEDNLDQFYDILVRTAERKGFSVHPLTYFQDLKRNFGKSAKFMLAYLDCPAYLAYLDENIKSFETKIQALKDGPQKKRTKGQIADAQDQLRSYYKRLEQFKTYQNNLYRLIFLWIMDQKSSAFTAGMMKPTLILVGQFFSIGKCYNMLCVRVKSGLIFMGQSKLKQLVLEKGTSISNVNLEGS